MDFQSIGHASMLSRYFCASSILGIQIDLAAV